MSHDKALKESHAKLTKKNTELNMVVNQMKKDRVEFERLTLEKLEATIRLYDTCNEKVVAYMNTLGLSDVCIKHVKSLFPIKIG